MTGIDSVYLAGGVFDPQEELGDEVLVAELLAESLIRHDGVLGRFRGPSGGRCEWRSQRAR